MKKRILYIDILNIIAILAVLFLHHDFGVHYFSQDKRWIFDTILKIVMYFCIPVFLMITGANLLGYKQKYDTKTYFRKRVIKIIIPMVAWFIIVGCIRFFVFKNLNIPTDSITSFINFIMRSGVLDYYWYLFLIIAVYFTIPILSPLSENKNRALLKYAIVVIFVCNAFMPNIMALVGVEWNQDLLVKVGTYMIFPLIGFYISKYNITKRRNRILLYSLGLMAIIYQFISTVVLSYVANKSVLTTLGYVQFPTILYSSAIFCFVRNINMKEDVNCRAKKFLSTLAGCSFGVYLIHYIVMKWEAQAFSIRGESFAWRFICPFLTYTISVAIVLVIKKIPIVRKIVP